MGDQSDRSADSKRLEELIQVPRSEIKAGLVQAVLVQELSAAEKIERIEVIDLHPEGAPEGAPEPAAPRKSKGVLIRPPKPAEAPPNAETEEPQEILTPHAAERDEVEAQRRKLGAAPHAGGWWGYLTGGYHALLRFGFESSTIRRGLLPLTLKLSPELVVFLSKSLREQVLPVLNQGLPGVLKKAWSVLSKTDYNLLAALHTLCRFADSVRAPQSARGYRLWLPMLGPVVPSLALFWTADGLTGRTLQAWSHACLKLGIAENLRISGGESIRTLLEARSDQMSLPDAARALASLKAHRVVQFDEFLPHETVGKYFAHDSFDCNAEVQAEIDKTVTQLVGRLESLEQETEEIRRVRYFVPEQAVLERFYNSSAHPNHDFADDTLETLKWTVRFLDLVAESVTPLLNGVVTLESGDTATLLRNDALAASLERLAALKSQFLDPIQSRTPGLTLDTARILTSLGKMLISLIRNRSRSADPLARSADPERLTDPLPREEEKLDRPVEWAGQTVIEALVRSAQVCLLAGRFLGDNSLSALLEKSDQIRTEAHELQARIVALAVPTRADECKTRFAALLVEEEHKHE